MTDSKTGDGAFLQAWYDPVAGLRAFSQSLRLVDLAGDNDYRLLAADLDKKLRVYRDTSISSVHTILDTPVSLAVFYPEVSVPRTPSVAIAAGANVYIYRNLRPYLKFTLPQVPMTEAEIAAQEAYGKPAAGTLLARVAAGGNSSNGAGAGSAAQNNTSSSSSSSSSGSGGGAVLKHTVVTCLESAPRDREGEGEQSSLVVGTEAGQVLFLDAAGSAIEKCIDLPSVPVHIVVHGCLKGEHRITVSCRDGIVYAIREKELLSTKIEPPAQPVSIVRTDAYLFVATIDSRVTVYEPKGKKLFTLPQPSAVTAMTRVNVKRDRGGDCVAVALEGGAVRVYNGQVLVTSLQCSDTIVAMRFGQYGREANTLVLASRSGSLSFRMLKRTASLEAVAAPAGPPPEQDIPLAVPKKTRLYLDQTQRERDAAPDMYRIFQRDLTKLRLTTARAYVKILTDGGGGGGDATRGGGAGNCNGVLGVSTGSAAGAALRLNCAVQGIGPRFRIKLDIQNGGVSSIPDVLFLFVYENAAYHMDMPTRQVPILLPNVRYEIEGDITCISPTGAAGVVRVHVCRGAAVAAAPLVTAVIGMPMSQPLPAAM